MSIIFFKAELQQKVNIKLEQKYNEIYKNFQILETNYKIISENVNNKYEILLMDAIIKCQDITKINTNNYNKLFNNYNKLLKNYNLLLKDYEYLNALIIDNKKAIKNNNNNKNNNKMIYNLKFLTSI
jgi:hypothetical protein